MQKEETLKKIRLELNRLVGTSFIRPNIALTAIMRRKGAGDYRVAIDDAANNLPHKKQIEKAVNYIYQYQDKIIVSDNTYAIQEAIEYMGQSENGRKTLKNCRFLFLNRADREKITKLAKEYGFKYSYPKVD